VSRASAAPWPLPRAGSTVMCLVVVGVTTFLAHYSLARGFGLYEDDYWAVAPYLAQQPADLLPLLVDCFTTWPQGRPLNHFLPPMLAVLGAGLGGLQGAYVLAAAWLTLNAMLVFLIVRRLLSPAAGLAAALAYVLFPADSTKILLIHASEHQGAMTLLLLGVWLWLRGGPARAASYPVAAAALLAFEAAFLPFLVVPLLGAADRRRSVRAWMGHGAACALLLGLDVALRLAQGESRMVEAAGRSGQTLWRAFSSLGIGPWTSGSVLLASIPEGWRGAVPHGVLSAALFAGVLSLALVALGGASPPAPAGPEGEARPRPGRAGADGALSWMAVLVAGLFAWAGSYALTLINYPPTLTIGRLTSIHIAAAWGVALALGALFEGARRRARRSASAVLVVVLASWLLYQHGIQRQFAEAWRLQGRFWKQVLSLVPEARDGWTVLVQGRPVEGPPAILVNSWADILVYRALVPAEDGPPVDFGHLGHLGDQLRFQRRGDQVEWRPEFWRGIAVPIDPDRLALLRDEGGILTRVEVIETAAGPLRARAPIPPPGPGLPGPGPVGQVMFGR
jgi:hypothetical protein